jgi:antitoxin (DNA-binding transcriptional repressor) of toxin-antitoxin stability system
VTVTERGVPKWRITPFDEPNDPLARAARAGRLTRAPAPPRPWRQPDQPTDMTAEAVTRLIAEMKDDR